MSNYLDYFVLTKKTVVMQRLADLARTGHVNYIAGTVPADRAGYLAGKFDEHYRVGLSRLEQSRRRKAGKSSARLLMLADPEQPQGAISWWLVRTDGELSPPGEAEKWRSLIDDRIIVTGYELVRHTRAGASAPSWTWRYKKETEASLRDALLRSIRTKRDDELRQLIHTIFRTPGFAGAREQVKKMVALIRGEWKRTRAKDESLPDIPKALGYIRRLADVGMRLSDLGVKKRGARKAVAVAGALSGKDWQSGFDAGETGQPSDSMPAGADRLSWLAGFIDGDAKRQKAEEQQWPWEQ